jgi:hypothetical protein
LILNLDSVTPCPCDAEGEEGYHYHLKAKIDFPLIPAQLRYEQLGETMQPKGLDGSKAPRQSTVEAAEDEIRRLEAELFQLRLSANLGFSSIEWRKKIN